MDISVIIPTRNRAKLLSQMLTSLACQKLSGQVRYEVIVVDNGSTDATPQMALDAKACFDTFVYHVEHTPGLHAARHAGLRLARGEICVFCDDDIVPSATWLSGILDGFLIPRVEIVTGPCTPLFEVSPPDWVVSLQNVFEGGWCLYDYSLLDLGLAGQYIPPELAFGCNFAIRKQSIIRYGGFLPDSMPAELLEYRGEGETALSQSVAAAGKRTFYSPDARVDHVVSRERLTPAYIYKRAYAEGITQSYRLVRSHGGRLDFPEEAVPGMVAVPPDSAGEEAWVKAKKQRGFIDGFWFHQRRLHENPKLLEWVLRPTYLDYEMVDLPSDLCGGSQ